MNIQHSDALIDSDGDGTSNLQEYLAGTDPFVFDGLRILSAHIRSNAVCELTMRAAVGMTCRLETSTNLIQWSPLCTFLCQTTNYAVPTVFDPKAPAQFFRLCTTTNRPIPSLALASVPRFPTNSLLLRLTGPPGYRYSVLASTNLINWAEITNFNAVVWSTEVPDPAFRSTTRRFYRAMTR